MSDTSALRSRLEEGIARNVEEKTVTIYPQSLRERGDAHFGLVCLGSRKKLVIQGKISEEFDPERTIERAEDLIHLCPLSVSNASALRTHFPWTSPRPLGRTSALGCGDRLGIASPGHIRACRDKDVVPVLAQQSIREMERTNRTAQQVLDDATWAVFQEGFTDGFGADADHLKTTDAVDSCVAAGYTMYTIDPSDHVDTDADHLSGRELSTRFEALPWDRLSTSPEKTLDRYADRAVRLDETAGSTEIEFTEEVVRRSAVKYGSALAHTSVLAGHLARRYARDRPGEDYDLEMSIDETDHPTRPQEHYFVAAELDRLDVNVTSLAPRFTGDFQKGIDFIGNLDRFEETFRRHTIIAQAFGGYKLSIHSGSDKFSAFPILGRHAGEHLHLKTAGTSFLEALRLAARHAPDLFREVVSFAFERFEKDRKTYHVTTNLDAIPDPTTISSEDLERAYLEDDNGRQLLHITYGSVLTARENGEYRFRDRLYDVLNEHEEEHYETIWSHFIDHIESVGWLASDEGDGRTS